MKWGARVARLMSLFLQDSKPPEMPDYTKFKPTAKRGPEDKPTTETLGAKKRQCDAPTQAAATATKRCTAAPAPTAETTADCAEPSAKRRKTVSSAEPVRATYDVLQARLVGKDVHLFVQKNAGTAHWTKLVDLPVFVQTALQAHRRARGDGKIIRLDGYRNLCVFRAVYGSLHPRETTQAVKTAAAQLRRDVCARIRANPDLLRLGWGSQSAPIPLIESCHLDSIGAYADGVQSGRIMGGEPELFLMHRILRRPIHVWLDDGIQYTNFTTYTTHTAPGSSGAAHILWNGVNHYDIYVPQ